MLNYRLKRLLVFALALCAQPARAFLDPPYVTPTNPTAGEPVSVNIYSGSCDAADDGVAWPPPVTQQGTVVTILLTGIHEEDPEWCDIGIGTQSFSVGSYPVGSYTLDVERRYMAVFGSWVQETLGVVPFTVTSAPSAQPIDAPTLSVAGLVGLLLMLACAALCALRVRMRELH